MEIIETTFFCGLDQISLPKYSRNGSKFLENYFITTDKGVILDLVLPLCRSIGSIEFDYLTIVAKAVIYRKGTIECQSERREHVSQALADQLIDDMVAVQILDSMLWMIKDNACHFDRAWIAGKINGSTIVNNNVWSSRPSCADGLFNEVSFSFDEFQIVRRSRRQMGTYLGASGAPTALSKELLRLQRFEYFIGAARSSHDVAVKIALYCSGLEALVSTSQQELSHQVSERVAAVLVGPGPKRVAIFKLMKRAYGFRSKTVHGASFKPTEMDQLRECSKIVDHICRALQALYFDDEDPSFRSAVEASDDKSSEFFVEAILGARKARDRLGIEVAI
ncbi:HEPN domain-containing protein [Ancylobacter sp. SL191]|uniref:HEPN domain-containing protein n=1 Tax=Ancylobacter sp. SL191 TaxID=2995166 RepID=UPI00226DE889|nr:HEPN domain-containing protein [Ancylobacter sp. SL191]WAC27505.1 HEPN domain-containing protein [Ancylobacter sp. SL191]